MITTNLTKKEKNKMLSVVGSFFMLIPIRITDKTIMDYAAKHRRMTTGPRQGPYDPYYTPYWIEPANCMSPNSSIQRVVIMKSVQIGVTTIMENVICFYINEYPADIMYISGTEKLLKNWVETKLDPAIDAFGLRKYIKAISESGNYRKTGDTTYSKLYNGCSLHLATARASSGLRNLSKMILIRDEIDDAPIALVSGEGNFLEVSNGRVQAYGRRAKILDTSTPTLANSLINTEFLKGDCREYNVPCPNCKGVQHLEFGDDYSEYGLKGEIEGSRVIDCYYLCRHCGYHIEEHNKTRMLLDGEWIPTKESDIENMRSYTINSLYGPLGMTSWNMLYSMWQNSKNDRESDISFTNLYKGVPYIDDGEKVKIDDIMNNMSGYKSFDIPEDVLFLTAGVDVQEGSKVNKENPPRIEMEILAHGRQYKTWSIAYIVFEGQTKDPYKGAWKKLYDYCKETNLTYTGINGAKYQVQFGLIDSGNGRWVDTVYRFCQRIKIFYPSKGVRDLKKKPGEKYLSDLRTTVDKVKYRRVVYGADGMLVLIATVSYKDTLYSRLSIERQDGEIQRPGFCDFPNDYKRSYYDMLTSETRNDEDGSYSNHGRRNEALDCRVYAMCAADVYVDYNVDMMRKGYIKSKKVTQEKANNKIRSPQFLTYLEGTINKQIKSNFMN